MRRRASIATLAAGGALSLAVRAQERMRRVGLMQPLAEDDTEGQPRIAAVREALHEGTPPQSLAIIPMMRMASIFTVEDLEE